MKGEPNGLIVEGTVKSFYVKTLIEYDSASDYSLPKKGLNYEIGEILFVKNASDINWWHARKLNPTKISFDNIDEGIIPSAERLRKKFSNREIAVNFEEKTIVIESNGSQTTDKINSSIIKGSGSLDLKKKRQQAYTQGTPHKAEGKDQLTNFYEIVESIKSTLPRPVIAAGPGRSILYDKLIEKYPDVFSSPVNHTTRLKREKETEGIDYHFIESKEAFQKDKDAGLFVETVEFGGNHYGTSLLSVKNVMESKRHCIIDATMAVIKNLENNGIFPITILVCPDTLAVAKTLMGEGCSEKVIKSNMQYASQLNSKERLMFSVKIRCETIEELLYQAYTSIKNCQKWGVWKRSPNQTKLSASC